MLNNKKKIFFGVILSLLIGGSMFFLHDKKKADPPTEEFFIESQIEEDSIVETEKQPITEKGSTEIKIVVDVKGAVVKPGIYPSKEGERVHDLILKAGGVVENANINAINLAQKVEDQMVIYVPVKGEVTNQSVVSTVQVSSNSEDQPSDKVNINLADETTLQTLPGIGPSKAAAILEYRKQNGSFKTVEDLKNISGIGDKTFEKFKDVITVE
ncbi:helix-hairpin-helix domain-containing protein [Peribacillus alkalitolerans]|uniref:helix-hairpin-helix domain-containing protein n=1 Tax=Peribacillus alkalitolerans TaxID=1550385 RepID=UPI0013D330C4|nr:helix-hairpin-helix domain-containing protein [Peribacillus alkalitolerans]